MCDGYPDNPGARQSSPETSFEVASHVADAAKSRERLARVLIRNRGLHGATADEVAQVLGWLPHYAARPRLSGMKARGEIVDSGTRRAGLSGRRQVAWITPEHLAQIGGDA